MLGQRELTTEDYVGILRRRVWVIVIPLILGPLVAYGISLVLAPEYTSQSLVLVEDQQVPENYVRSVVTGDLGQRLVSMQEQILSRTRLQPLVERFQLYREDWNKVPMEDLVDRVRKSIRVRPVDTAISRNREQALPGFNVLYTTSDPKVAQQMCREITSLFMAENLKERQEKSEGTVQFVETQLNAAKANLDQQDARLAAFKQKNVGQLPGQEQTNLNILMSMNTQLEAVSAALNSSQQDKVYMEAQLAQQLAAWQASQQGTNPQTLEQQLAQAQRDLADLRSRYFDDYPDVKAAKDKVEQLKKSIEDAKKETKAQKPPEKSEAGSLAEPPQIQQLRNTIHLTEMGIAEKKRIQERLQQDIKTQQTKVQFSPVVEQAYKELTRDYEAAVATYNDLLKKKSQSTMAADLEKRQQGEQFSVMDEANLPEKPSFPNRLLFAGGGLGGGMALGLGIALLLEMRDKAIRCERDIEFFLGVPTLAQIPSFEDPEAGKGNRWKRKSKAA